MEPALVAASITLWMVFIAVSMPPKIAERLMRTRFGGALTATWMHLEAGIAKMRTKR